MTTLTEAYRPRPEASGSAAFRLEYSPDTPAQAIQKDLESFLGEYVFELSEYQYTLDYKKGRLVDPYTKETMIGKTIKAIDLRRGEKKITTREEAELGGFARLEKQLADAQEGDSIVWMSPPGSQSEGYGDWGFVYLGEVSDNSHLSMTAIRVEKPAIEDYRPFFQALSKDSFHPLIAEDFIANPLVVSHKDSDQIRNLMAEFFTTNIHDSSSGFVQTLDRVAPYINQYLEIVQTGGSKKLEQQVFNLLLNYSLTLKDDFEKRNDVGGTLPFLEALKQYGSTTPVLIGSCGATGSSNSLFNTISPLNRILDSAKKHWDYHDGECVVCSKKNAEVGPCNICKNCEKKFD